MRLPLRLQLAQALPPASIWPGLLLAAAIAAAASVGSELIGVNGLGFARSPVSPVLLAILMGLAAGNLIALADTYSDGIDFARDKLLKTGIVLLGLQISISAIARVGIGAVPVVLGCITAALVFVTLLSRALGLNERLGALIAVGTSICGCTAIVAAAPVMRARQSEACYAIACVALFGTVGMLVWPFVANALFAGHPEQAGMLLGTAIHDTSQVIGAGMLYEQYFGDAATLEAATVTKLLRNLCMLLVIPLLAWRFADRDGSSGGGRSRLRDIVPVFIAGFVAMSLLRTGVDTLTPGGAAWDSIVAIGKETSSALLTIAMAAVGLSTSFAGIRQTGFTPLAVGFAAAILVGMTSLALISWLG